MANGFEPINYHAVIVYSGQGTSPAIRKQIARLADDGLRGVTEDPYAFGRLPHCPTTWVTLDGETDSKVIPLPDFDPYKLSNDESGLTQLVAACEQALDALKVPERAKRDASASYVDHGEFVSNPAYAEAWLAEVRELGAR